MNTLKHQFNLITKTYKYRVNRRSGRKVVLEEDIIWEPENGWILQIYDRGTCTYKATESGLSTLMSTKLVHLHMLHVHVPRQMRNINGDDMSISTRILSFVSNNPLFSTNHRLFTLPA